MNRSWTYLDTISPSIRATVQKIKYGSGTLDQLATQLRKYSDNVQSEATKQKNKANEQPFTGWDADI